MLSISLSGAFNLPEVTRNPWLEPAPAPTSSAPSLDRCQWSPESREGNGNSLNDGLLQGLQDNFNCFPSRPVGCYPSPGGTGGEGGQGGEGGVEEAQPTKKRRERSRVRKSKGGKTTKKTTKTSRTSPAKRGSAGGAGGSGAPSGGARPGGSPAGGARPSGAPSGATRPSGSPAGSARPAPAGGARPGGSPAGGSRPAPAAPRPGGSAAPSRSGMPSATSHGPTGRPTASANGITVSAPPSSGRGPLTPAVHPNRPAGAPVHPALSGQPLGRSAPSGAPAPGGSPVGSPAPGGPSPSGSSLAPGSGKVGSLGPQMDQWDGDILREAQKWGVPPENLKALIALESEGNPNAHQVNPTYGDTYGLGQINANIWGSKANQLGYDLGTPEGQIGMAAYLLNQGYQERGSWDGAHSWYFNPSGGGDSVNGTSNDGYIGRIHELIAQMGGYQ